MHSKDLPPRAKLLPLLKGRTITFVEFANPSGEWNISRPIPRVMGLPEELEDASPLALLDALRCLANKGLVAVERVEHPFVENCKKECHRLLAQEKAGMKVWDSDWSVAQDALHWYEEHPTEIFHCQDIQQADQGEAAQVKVQDMDDAGASAFAWLSETI